MWTSDSFSYFIFRIVNLVVPVLSIRILAIPDSELPDSIFLSFGTLGLSSFIMPSGFSGLNPPWHCISRPGLGISGLRLSSLELFGLGILLVSCKQTVNAKRNRKESREKGRKLKALLWYLQYSTTQIQTHKKSSLTLFLQKSFLKFYSVSLVQDVKFKMLDYYYF